MSPALITLEDSSLTSVIDPSLLEPSHECAQRQLMTALQLYYERRTKQLGEFCHIKRLKWRRGEGGGCAHNMDRAHCICLLISSLFIIYFISSSQDEAIGLIMQHVSIKLYLHLSLGNPDKHHNLATQNHTFGAISIFSFRM